MQVTWQKFHEGGQTVEVQFFAPESPSHRLILFCPGFPGRGGTMFEQRHAAALAQFRGHTVGIIKHAGTRLDGPDAPFMVNNAGRLLEARQKGEKHLGGGPSTVANWLKEPLIVLDKLRDAFSHIDVIGNSFGAVSALWSLIQPSAPVDKIKTLMLYAGAQGVDSDPFTGIMRVWNPVYLSTPAIWEKVTLDEPMSINATMKQAYADIAEKAGHLPHGMEIQYVVVDNDEILNPADTEAFKHHVMGGRGHIHIAGDRAYPAYGIMAHDTPDFPTEKLMELLK
jgi:hypothetical protein